MGNSRNTRRKKMAGRGLNINPNPDLPSEIIEEILSWLPVKPLCRFKCVSKSWRSLISDPRFMHKHLNKATEHEHVLCQRRRLVFNPSGYKTICSLNLDDFLQRNPNAIGAGNTGEDDCICGDDDAVTDLDYVYSKFPDKVFRFRGANISHCNGLLLCELPNDTLYLVNPATRESRKLPYPPKKLGKNAGTSRFGFGFDHSTLDYKVVRMSTGQGRFTVFSLKTGLWRAIPMPVHVQYKGSYLGLNGVFLNKGIHWLVGRAASMALISFDLNEEDVRGLPLPPKNNFGSSGVEFPRLGVWRGCLCITLPSIKKVLAQLWVMKEYGVEESWTKINFPFPYSVLYHSGSWTEKHDLLIFLNRLVMYNFDDQSFRLLPIGGVRYFRSFQMYLESLVSPNLYPTDRLRTLRTRPLQRREGLICHR